MLWSEQTWREFSAAIEDASLEQGRALFNWMVEDLSALIEWGMCEEPPLGHS